MMKLARTCRLFLLVLVLSIPQSTFAQTEPDSLRLFVEDLLTDFMFAEGRPEIRVGALATRIPPLPLTTEEEVLGSVEYPSFSLSLLRTRRASELIARAREHLQQQGWRLVARDVPTGFSMTPARTSALLCSDSSFISIGSDGQGQATIAEGSGMMLMSQCVEPPPRDPDGLPISPLPSLDAPAGAKSFGTASSGGGDSWLYSTRLIAELSPKEILDHYSWELTQAGGTFAEASVTPQSAVAPITIVDSQGAVWRGTMIVVIIAPDQRSVYVQLLRLQ
jgi:hypothetical protein